MITRTHDENFYRGIWHVYRWTMFTYILQYIHTVNPYRRRQNPKCLSIYIPQTPVSETKKAVGHTWKYHVHVRKMIMIKNPHRHMAVTYPPSAVTGFNDRSWVYGVSSLKRNCPKARVLCGLVVMAWTANWVVVALAKTLGLAEHTTCLLWVVDGIGGASVCPTQNAPGKKWWFQTSWRVTVARCVVFVVVLQS
jgi:hypothetical protein